MGIFEIIAILQDNRFQVLGGLLGAIDVFELAIIPSLLNNCCTGYVVWYLETKLGGVGKHTKPVLQNAVPGSKWHSEGFLFMGVSHFNDEI